MALTSSNIDGIVINEVMIDGSGPVFDYDTNGDGTFSAVRDDFVELLNTSGAAVDISGWQIWDHSAMVHTIAPGTILQPGEFYTVISDPGTGGTPNVDGTAVFASTGSLSLGTTYGFVQLLNPNTGEYVQLNIENWDKGLNPITNAGTSLQGVEETAAKGDGQSTQRSPDGDTNFIVATPTPKSCFLAGTRISTPDGPVLVEDLAIGQVLCTPTGTTEVLWLGVQTVSPRFNPADRLRPVEVRAGALGNGLPMRNLRLTSDHALELDGLLINAGALVGAPGIDWVPKADLGRRYRVYHIETRAHEIVLAEGAAAETFIDYVDRSAFDNYDEYLSLYGTDRTIAEHNAPRISSTRHIPAGLRRRLGLDAGCPLSA